MSPSSGSSRQAVSSEGAGRIGTRAGARLTAPSARGGRWLVAAAPITLVALLAIWQAVCSAGIMPPYLLPSPVAVLRALVGDWPLLAGHAVTTLAEAGIGLAAGIALGALAAVAMDRFELLYRAFYPLVVLTQTIPTVCLLYTSPSPRD